MINAIVVDDERIARQGLLSLTDWSKYGIQFIGEARDGLQAIQLVNEQPVELMFVDITMPNMNGFELMKRVQEHHPSMQFVILTCHHEFDYAKQALQLGAIDYIVKTLLNRNNVDEIMNRIIQRVQKDRERKHLEGAVTFEGGTYLYTKDRYTTLSMLEQTYGKQYRLKPLSERLIKLIELDSETYGHAKSNPDRHSFTQMHGVMLHVRRAEQFSQYDIEHWLQHSIEQYLFYANHSTDIVISEEEIINWQLSASQIASYKQWQEQYLQYKWLVFPHEYQRWIQVTEQLHPDKEDIRPIVEHLYKHIVRLIDWEQARPEELMKMPDLGQWKSIEQWFAMLSLHIRGRMADYSLSHEVVICILKSVQYMQDQLGLNLNQNDVAYQVGMSRSYFSQCFKKFYGISFGEVIRQMRIEAAKNLLATTHLTISDIAGQIGFEDHKYFSRTFKLQLGMYPTEYRSLYVEMR